MSGLMFTRSGSSQSSPKDGVRGEAREYSRRANTPAALGRLAGKVGRDGVKLQFCYEAGAVRLWHPTPFVGARARMRRGGAVAHPKATGQPGEDRSRRWRQPGPTAPGGRADGHVGSGCQARSTPRPAPTRTSRAAAVRAPSISVAFFSTSPFRSQRARFRAVHISKTS
jgi:hypothetical protein